LYVPDIGGQPVILGAEHHPRFRACDRIGASVVASRIRPAIWATIAVGTTIVVAVVVVVLLRGNDEPGALSDCGVVGDLVTQWTDSVVAAQQTLATSTNSGDDTLALADSEAEMADEIRASTGKVDSPDIAGALEQWAAGAEKLARSHRDQINAPNPDVTAPPPPGYIEGSVAVQEATANLLKACPAATDS
jgi:hypothetical protein